MLRHAGWRPLVHPLQILHDSQVGAGIEKEQVTVFLRHFRECPPHGSRSNSCVNLLQGDVVVSFERPDAFQRVLLPSLVPPCIAQQVEGDTEQPGSGVRASRVVVGSTAKCDLKSLCRQIISTRLTGTHLQVAVQEREVSLEDADEGCWISEGLLDRPRVCLGSAFLPLWHSLLLLGRNAVSSSRHSF